MLRIPENRDLSHYFLRTPRNTNFQILSKSLIFPSSHPRTSWTSRYRGLQEEGDRFALPSGIVSSKEPTARKSYVPRLFRWTKTEKKGQKDREKRKGEHKKNCTKRMTRPVRDHIGHTDLPGWQPPRGIPRRATFLPVNSFALRTASKESLMSRVIIFYHIANLIYSVTLINFIEDWY